MAAQNFYKKDGSYYLVGSNQKILNLQQLNQYSQAGGREVSYTPPTQSTPPAGSVAIPAGQISNYNVTGQFGQTGQAGSGLWGTPINNNINSNTLQTGMQVGSISSQLPQSASQSAIDIYTQNSLQNGQQSLTELQKQYNTLSAQQLQQTQQGIQQTQGELTQLEQQRQNDIDRYRSITDPLYQQGADEYKRMLDSTKQIDYTALVKQRLELTQDIVSYSKLMRNELDVEAGRPALQSVSTGRQTAIQQNYLSKISTAQAATAAIDGNFNLAFDIMDRGATVIQNITADRINFLNFVSGIYDDKISDRRNKLITLTSDEKEQIDQLRGTLQKQIETVEKNKQIIQNLMSSPATAMIAHKAGLSLTDSPDVIAQKLNKYYVSNPTLIPDSIVSLQDKFPDAGINFWDSPDTINAKLKKSAIFKAGTTEASTTLTPNQLLDQAQAMVNSGQATDLADAISQIQNAMNGGGNVTPADNELLTPGVYGGQCGEYTHKIADNIPTMGDTFTSKMKLANISTKQWQVGDVLIQNVKTPYGHVSVVTAVNGNQVTVTESNWNNDEKVGTRTLTMGDKSVTGVYRGAKLKTNTPTPSERPIVLSDQETKAIDASPQAKKLTTLADLKRKADRYVALVDQYGTALYGTPAALLGAAFSELKISWKEAANLGALTGPDVAIIEQVMKQADGVKGKKNLALYGLEGIKSSITSAINNIYNDATKTYKDLISRNPKYARSEYVKNLYADFGSQSGQTDGLNDNDAYAEYLRMIGQ